MIDENFWNFTQSTVDWNTELDETLNFDTGHCLPIEHILIFLQESENH